MNIHFSILGTIFLSAVLSGCAQPQAKVSPRDLFAKIQIGMTRSQVDAILGAPFSADQDAWYLPPPSIEAHESPFAPGTIAVRFSEGGKVESKKLNPQFKE